MKIELRVDYGGVSYLELTAKGDGITENMLKLFIREARQKGIDIKNESSIDSSDNYASIRIKEITKKD